MQILKFLTLNKWLTDHQSFQSHLVNSTSERGHPSEGNSMLHWMVLPSSMLTEQDTEVPASQLPQG